MICRPVSGLTPPSVHRVAGAAGGRLLVDDGNYFLHGMSDQLERLKTDLADRCVIERELGRRGMATVYLARVLKSNRKIVLHVLRSGTAAEPYRITFGTSDWYVHGGGWAWDGSGLAYSRDADRGDLHLIDPIR